MSESDDKGNDNGNEKKSEKTIAANILETCRQFPNKCFMQCWRQRNGTLKPCDWSMANVMAYASTKLSNANQQLIAKDYDKKYNVHVDYDNRLTSLQKEYCQTTYTYHHFTALGNKSLHYRTFPQFHLAKQDHDDSEEENDHRFDIVDGSETTCIISLLD